ncbi:hypothetical protein VTN77DRAFT_1597 [Rasamsonia byssochlamydoides]|uniref:uncharacterized protein n=1 Tax=Rasamsonia byssochlamydoides TaxID=89139 RepID=UPI0037447157
MLPPERQQSRMLDAGGGKRVWASLITNLDYLPGLLTLAHSLRRVGSQYPLVALYTDTVPATALAALDARKIPRRRVPFLQPAGGRHYTADARFNDTWTKLVAFSLVEYDRVVLLDSDMLVRKNIDELMTLDLDPPELEGNGQRVFAASHACACNPLRKPHYPKDWIPSNCAFTTQHSHPAKAQTEGPPPSAGIAMLNSGLLVVNPSAGVFSKIQKAMNTPALVDKYDFPDQGLLSDIFAGRWVVLPYVYNALKTLRWEGVHSAIWRDDQVKVVHYIFAVKPWHQLTAKGKAAAAAAAANGNTKGNLQLSAFQASDEITHRWWFAANEDRQRTEREAGINDGF